MDQWRKSLEPPPGVIDPHGHCDGIPFFLATGRGCSMHTYHRVLLIAPLPTPACPELLAQRVLVAYVIVAGPDPGA